MEGQECPSLKPGAQEEGFHETSLFSAGIKVTSLELSSFPVFPLFLGTDPILHVR